MSSFRFERERIVVETVDASGSTLEEAEQLVRMGGGFVLYDIELNPTVTLLEEIYDDIQ